MPNNKFINNGVYLCKGYSTIYRNEIVYYFRSYNQYITDKCLMLVCPVDNNPYKYSIELKERMKEYYEQSKK